MVLGSAFAAADMREGNFNIRIEPTANLQTGAQIPFSIQVSDALHKPLPSAKVTLQIEKVVPETEKDQDKHVKVYPAPALDPGTYIAKPVFPEAGQWNLYVEVRRADQLSSRTIQFNIPK